MHGAFAQEPPETVWRFSILFFAVPSQDNAIYNLLPDIISRLSDPERHMTTEDFNTIMKSVACFGVFFSSSGHLPRLFRESSSVEYILGQSSFVSSSEAWCVCFSDSSFHTSPRKGKRSPWWRSCASAFELPSDYTSLSLFLIFTPHSPPVPVWLF